MTRIGQRRPSAFASRRSRRSSFTGLEALESRRMLTTTGTVITPNLTVISPARGFGGYTPIISTPSGLTPSQLYAAYALVPNGGAGQTIGIVDAYNDPNVQSDLAVFDSTFGLPAASLTVDNESGTTTRLPSTDPGWSQEIAMDVEWAHAAAPMAKLVLVEANSENTPDLMAAVRVAASRANIVSMSWGGGEFSGQQAYDNAAYFAHPNVTFLAASGDDGGQSGAEWPATSPYVVGVGGTTLTLNYLGGYGTESAWSASGSRYSGYSGSAGGVSTIYPEPAYQTYALGRTSGRSTPDVSLVGNPTTGLSVYDTVPGDGSIGWATVGGTSAGTPIWAGIVAVADQARGMKGLGSLGSSQTLGLLYSLYAQKGTTYASTFHDITSGANFVGQATAGYDLVTGIGTPIARNIIAVASTYGSATSSQVVKAAAVVSTRVVAPKFVVNSLTNPTATTAILATLPNLGSTSIAPNPVNVSTASASNSALSAQSTGLNPPTTSIAPARPIQSLTLAPPTSSELPVDGQSPSLETPGLPGLFLDPTSPTLESVGGSVLASAGSATSARVWDLALDGFAEEIDLPVNADDFLISDPIEPGFGLRSALAGVLALTFWSLAEYRSRKTDDDRKPPTFDASWSLN